MLNKCHVNVISGCFTYFLDGLRLFYFRKFGLEFFWVGAAAGFLKSTYGLFFLKNKYIFPMSKKLDCNVNDSESCVLKETLVISLIFKVEKIGIYSDKTMAVKFMYILNDDTQNYPLCTLQLDS